MAKVVINKCYGGFGLSREAFLRLRELGCQAAIEEPDIGEFWGDGSGPRSSASGSFCTEIKRDDLLLIQVVKEMGKEANSFLSSLAIVKIPEGVIWEIEEYDGKEWIAEVHRTWG